ncbi:MAG: hypothetical protein DRQ64_00875 [Gammaproteobacteria bacterium]|nr:MAG: hypothetical protein DRQ64_00875 [Gammaproteobacteria bacterium]
MPKYLSHIFQSLAKQTGVKQRPSGNSLPVNGKANAAYGIFKTGASPGGKDTSGPNIAYY